MNENKKKALSQILTLVEVEALMREGRDIEALKNLKDRICANSNDADAWYLLGALYYRQGLLSDALDAFNHSKLIDPKGPAASAVESVLEQIRDSSLRS